MQEIIVNLASWPGIYAFLAVATIAAWNRLYLLMLVAFAMSLPGAFNLFGGNGWTQWMAFYIPLSLLLCVRLLKRGSVIWPGLLLLPIYTCYLYLRLAQMRG